MVSIRAVKRGWVRQLKGVVICCGATRRKMFRSIGLPELLVIVIVIGCLILPFWKILEKAGYPGVMGLMMLVPFLNFVMLLYLAFSDWPVLRQLREAQNRNAAGIG
jgi:hypothetical protein